MTPLRREERDLANTFGCGSAAIGRTYTCRECKTNNSNDLLRKLRSATAADINLRRKLLELLVLHQRQV
jgi:hypothetical protein